MECRGILVTTQWEPAVKIRYLVGGGREQEPVQNHLPAT